MNLDKDFWIDDIANEPADALILAEMVEEYARVFDARRLRKRYRRYRTEWDNIEKRYVDRPFKHFLGKLEQIDAAWTKYVRRFLDEVCDD